MRQTNLENARGWVDCAKPNLDNVRVGRGLRGGVGLATILQDSFGWGRKRWSTMGVVTACWMAGGVVGWNER